MTWKFPTEVNKAGKLRAVPLQSVESKLGRTGESELAERETGERRLLPSFPSAFARFARFPRSRNHPEGLLAVYKAGSAFWAIKSWRISYSSNEKGTEAKKRPAIVSGILTSDASFCYWPIFPLPLVTVPEVFAKVNSVQFPSRFCGKVANKKAIHTMLVRDLPVTDRNRLSVQHL